MAGAAGSRDGVPVVMSDAAWNDYRVTGYPFFVLVDAVRGVIVGETVGFGWPDVRALIEASATDRPERAALQLRIRPRRLLRQWSERPASVTELSPNCQQPLHRPTGRAQACFPCWGSEANQQRSRT